MDPKSVITWAICLAVGWLLFASLTGADEWLRSLFGTGRSSDLEARYAEPLRPCTAKDMTGDLAQCDDGFESIRAAATHPRRVQP